MSTEEDLGKEDSTSSDRRAYMRSIWYNQKTTPCIKWREKLRETQLSVLARERRRGVHTTTTVGDDKRRERAADDDGSDEEGKGGQGDGDKN